MRVSCLSKYFFVLLFSCVGSFVAAQTPELDNPELTSSPQGNELTACQSIRLKTGFHHSAAGGKVLRLKTDPAVCTPFVYEPVAASANQNFIMTITPLDATDQAEYKDGVLTIGRDVRALTQIEYFDGLGRLTQTVQRGVTPAKGDLVSMQEYDAFGRESNGWLPIPISSDGAFVEPEAFFPAATGWYGDSKPYARPVYEPSPLNRVVEQFGPGSAWHSGHPVKTGYETNVKSDPELGCRYYFIANPGSVTLRGEYASGELFVTRSTDEDGRVMLVFKDKLDRLVLSRQIYGEGMADTYYVYDDFGNQCCVLSPEASDRFKADATLNASSEAIGLYGYAYRYDERNRCIEKKLPGCDPVFMVYDRADRPVLSQNGEQRKKSVWSFIKYDVFGRPVLEGTMVSALSHNALMESYREVLVTESFEANGLWKYTETNAPLTADAGVTVLKANYYDRYGELPVISAEQQAMLGYRPESGYGAQYTGGGEHSAKGLLTATLTRVLHSDKMLATVSFYDDKGRVIQQRSTNHLDGLDLVYTAFDFSGQPLRVKRAHSVRNLSPVTELYAYEYDHAGRLLKTDHRVEGHDAVTLAVNEYDELGRVKSKRQGGLPGKIDYFYNIRSWVSGIQGSAFSQNLYYNESAIPGTTPQFGGNIAAQRWVSLGSKNRVYKYGYDGLNRLSNSVYGEGVNGSTAILYGFDETLGFDRNGNILSLKRNGVNRTMVTNTITGEKIEVLRGTVTDNLTYAYRGNQMLKVSDSAPALLYDGANDFSDGANADVEYVYDKNGNMTADLNKKISRIVYNQLNLPDSVFFDKKFICTRYDATGVKLSQTVPLELAVDPIPMAAASGFDPGEVLPVMGQTTDYVGSYIYKKGKLSRIQIPEGYISVVDGKFEYFFNQTDYQGNIRAVTDAKGAVIEHNDYYPFGMLFGTSVGKDSKQPFKFGGKEYISAKGFNTYDFGARGMDGSNPRWPSMDKFAEMYYSISPYAYCANNPTRYVDLKGDSVSVAKVQIYDNINSTNYTQATISDLQSQTGLTLTVSENGQMTYAKDSEGNPSVETTTDANGVETQNGSVTARNHLISLVDNSNTIDVGISNRGSKGGGSDIWLDPNQINSFTTGAMNINSMTLGWGMTFLHESYHTTVGGGLSDAPYTPGPVVSKMNTIRAELNTQGRNYGQRVNYPATLIGNERYLPFNKGASMGLRYGLKPLPIDRYIKF